MSSAPLTALVLSGGGARGAYEAGVMRYLRDEMPARISERIRFEILCGSSIGAVNCCYLAATSHVPHEQGRLLASLWENIRIEDVYQLSLKEIFSLPKFLLGSRGKGELDDSVAARRLGGLFNTSPLEKVIKNKVPWRYLKINQEQGNFLSLAINATHIKTGKTHVFVQSENKLPPWSTDPQIKAFKVDIGPSHALASSAIPWIFPAVSVDGEIYTDGSIKLNTPISPALRLGADRIFVVGLKSQDLGVWHHSNEESQVIDAYPSAPYLLGKILNALLVDKTEYDIKRLQRYNQMLADGQKRFGQAYIEHINSLMIKERGASYRSVDTLAIRPSMDIAAMASRHLETGSIATRAGSLVGPLLHRVGDIGVGQASDLLSYLLFDYEFASDLIRLGMHDADAKRSKIIDFFSF